MQLYIEYAADIYELYLKYFDPQDIHVYSIDESFIDVTDYLPLYNIDAVTFAKKLMNEIGIDSECLVQQFLWCFRNAFHIAYPVLG